MISGKYASEVFSKFNPKSRDRTRRIFYQDFYTLVLDLSGSFEWIPVS